MLDGVADLLPRVEVEAAFADGSRLVVLEDPVRRAAAPAPAQEPPVPWLDHADAVELEVVNEGAVPVGVTSHFHLFEVNPALRLDRAAAWGRRLAVPPGVKVFFAPGEPRTVRAVPFAGARVVRGHAGLVDGPLDAPGAREAALERARARGTAVPEGVRLADSALHVLPEVDEAGGPDALVPAWGGTMRDGLGVRAGRGGVDLAIVGGLVLDPVLGVRRTSIGVAGGRVVALGRAGNPDVMDDVGVVLDPATAVLDATGLVVTPGAVDAHVHWLSPQVGDAALAGGVTTMVIQDYGPVWNLGNGPAAGLRATWAALEGQPLNVAALVRASSTDPAPVEAALRAGGAGLKVHEDVGRARRSCAPRSTWPTATTSSSRSTPTASTSPSTCAGRSRSSTAARSTPSTSRAAAVGTRPTCSSWPARSTSSAPRRTRASPSARPRTPTAWRRSRPSTSPARARATATSPRSACGCAPPRWPPRASCTTSASSRC